MLSQKLHTCVFVENEFLISVGSAFEKYIDRDKNQNYEIMRYSEKRRVKKLGSRVIS